MATESDTAAPPVAEPELNDDLRRELKRALDRLMAPWAENEPSRAAGGPSADEPDPEESN